MKNDASNPARLVPLSQRGWIAIRGADARAFLHSQLSADLLNLSGDRWQAASYCTPQGRVSALMRVMGGDDGLYAGLPVEMREPTVERLKQFVLRSRVEIASLTDHGAFGCWGAGIGELFELIGLSLPEPNQGCRRQGDVYVLAIPGSAGRCIVQGPNEAVTDLWERSQVHAQVADIRDWHLQDIQAGWPEVYPATRNQFLPQSLNLEAWGGLSFTKGCFPGQEIIARTRYRGRVKQHLYRAIIAAAPPLPGSRILDARGKDAGTVLYAARSDARESRLLAVLRESDDGYYGLEDERLTQLELL